MSVVIRSQLDKHVVTLSDGTPIPGVLSVVIEILPGQVAIARLELIDVKVDIKTLETTTAPELPE